MKKITLLVMLFLAFMNLYSQKFFYNYEPILIKDSIPQSLIIDPIVKSDIELTVSNIKNASKREKKEYIYLSNYALSELLKSGLVYYNDAYSNYLNQVATYLFKDYDEFKNAKFFLVNTPVPNAVTWRQGYVFFNIGLIKYLENESQLAYVLCHEFVHYKNKHSLQQIENKQVDYSTNKEKRKNKEVTQKSSKLSKDVYEKNKTNNLQGLLNRLSFKRELEFEADKEGYKIYSKSNYNKYEPINALAILDHVDEDINKDSIDYVGLFNIKGFKLTKEDFGIEDKKSKNTKVYSKSNSKTSQSKTDEKKDSTAFLTKVFSEAFSTHPSIENRVKVIKGLTDTLNKNNGENYIVSKEKFNELKEVINFELIKYYYNNENLLQALYNIILLKRTYPDNLYLNKMYVKTLYKIALYKTNGRLVFLLDKQYKESKSYMNLYSLLQNISNERMMEMLNNTLLSVTEKFQEDETIQMYYCLMLALGKDKDKTIGQFEKYINKYPTGSYVDLAEKNIKQLNGFAHEK